MMEGAKMRRIEHVGIHDIQFKEIRTMKNNGNIRLVVAFAMLLGFIGQIAGPLVPSAKAAEPAYVQNTSYGSTYGEWTARWWQWVLSIPAAVNPNLDSSGVQCAQGQTDDVWFLAGNFGGTVARACTIPAGKPIFLPLINTVSFKPNGNETLLTLRGLAAGFIDTVDVSQLTFTIDGQAVVRDLSKFRVRSPSFTVLAPSGGILPPGQLTLPGNSDSIVSDGYWMLLNPLPTGRHTIKWHAQTNSGFVVDVTYNLIIQ
jgi:hypothetical protein